MSQNERMTPEELEFLAKRNKAINFRESLTPEKKEKVSQLYQESLPQLEAGLFFVNGLTEGVEVRLADYLLAEVDATDFYTTNEERCLLFSFTMGGMTPNHFLIVKQFELDRMVKGEYKETLHELKLALQRYYLDMTKNFGEPMDIKAMRVEDLNEAVRSDSELIEGDYEIKHFEITKYSNTMNLYLFSDINATKILYDGLEELEQKAEESGEDTPVEPSTQSTNSKEAPISQEAQRANGNKKLIMEGNVMKKELMNENQTPLYKPSFGNLDLNESVTEALGDLGLLYDIPVEVVVVLGSTKPTLGEVLEFGVGKIIELGKSEDEPLLIYVNGELVAEGEVVIVDENYAIKITKLYEKKVIKK